MAAAHVQSKSAISVAAVTSLSVSFAATVGVGSVVCGHCYWGASTDIVTSIADDKSNAYTVVDSQLNIQSDGRSAKSFYRANLTNGPITVTMSLSSSTQYVMLAVHEASGLDTSAPLDKNRTASQAGVSGTNAITTGSVTPVADGEYIYAGVAEAFATHSGAYYTAGTTVAYTKREEVFNGSALGDIASESFIQTTAGAIAGTWTPTDANNDSATFILTFKTTPAPPDLGRRASAMAHPKPPWQQQYAIGASP